MSNYRKFEFEKPDGCRAEAEIIRQISPSEHCLAFVRAVAICGQPLKYCPLYNPVRFSVTHPDSLEKAVNSLPEVASQIVTPQCPKSSNP